MVARHYARRDNLLIRPATLSDRAAIIEILKPEMAKYPLRPDKDKIWEGLTEAISAKRHFAWVAVVKKKVTGVILALTNDNLWAQRMNSNVVAWVANTPGTGTSLMRQFIKWVKSRRAIRVAGMAIDCEVDDRVWALAQRLGYERCNGTLHLFN